MASTNTKVRIGIIGCASVAEKHAIPAFKALDNAQLVGIASRDYTKAQAWAAKHGIEAAPSYEALLQRQDIGAVYIPLPIGLHEEWVTKAAKAGKHILCEKSLSTNFASAQRMVELCRSHHRLLYENFMCAFHPQHQAVLKMIHEGAIGSATVFQSYFGFFLMDKQSFRYDSALGGGSLNDVGAYTLFMARKIFGEPLAVTSSLIVDPDTNVDIQGSVLLEFSGNRSGLAAFGFDQVYQNNYSVWGSKGLLRVLRAYGIPANLKPPVELLTNTGIGETIASLDLPAANQFQLIFDDFCSAVAAHSANKAKAEEMYTAILAQAKLMEAVRISASEKRKVLLKEIETHGTHEPQ